MCLMLLQLEIPPSYLGSSAAPHTETCLVDCVCRPRSPQLECQSVPVEQSTRQTQPRESKAQAPGQEIALEDTPLRQRINSVFRRWGGWRKKGKKKKAEQTNYFVTSSRKWLCMIARIKGLLNPIR